MNRVSTAGTVAISDVYGDVAVATAAARPIMGERYPQEIEYVVAPQGIALRPFEWSNSGSGTLDTASFRPQTELGRRLWEIRKKSIANGMPLLNAEGIEREIQQRRGGQDDERL